MLSSQVATAPLVAPSSGLNCQGQGHSQGHLTNKVN